MKNSKSTTVLLNILLILLITVIFKLLIVSPKELNAGSNMANDQKQNVADTLYAKEFILSNDDGREIARLGQVPGGAGLWLRDDQEIIRLYVGMNKTDVTEIKLNDPNGKELISLSADEVGSMLSLKMSADTYRRVKASVNGGQGALFEVLNKNGQVGWRSPNVPNK